MAPLAVGKSLACILPKALDYSCLNFGLRRFEMQVDSPVISFGNPTHSGQNHHTIAATRSGVDQHLSGGGVRKTAKK
jgi:hypothetical protein